jgi:molybdate/tungstate transport system substrate-binding protein
MRPSGGFRRRTASLVAVVLTSVVSLTASSCTGAPVATSPKGRGTVEVLYAASLLRLMEQTLGPAFSSDSGYRFSGVAGGSIELAHEIASGLRRGDVFISASADADAVLGGATGGHFVSWYVDFARAPLVLGYDPHSAFAPALRRGPWYRVVTSPGFRLGRTDPQLDPKGRLTVTAIDEAGAITGDAHLRALLTSSDNVFAEESLLGRLEASQLDAAFLYLNEARAAEIPTIALSPVSPSTTFTVTILARAPDAPGARAFVRFLLGSEAHGAFRSVGIKAIDPPRSHGQGVPVGLYATALGR